MTAWKRASGGHALEAGFEILLTARADDLIGYLTLLEKQQCGNGMDPILGGKILVVVNVDLADSDAAIELLCQVIQDGREHLARPAPFSPKIHEDGRLRLQDVLRKIVLRERDD